MSKEPSADLFNLIKSMSKSEKKFFKLFASRHAIGGKNKYVALFDAIDRQESYDERALVEANRSLATIDLRSMKSYLHDLILRSLRDALRERSHLAKVQYQIDKAEILIHKGLFSQAARLLARTGEMARERGYLIKLIDILFLESSLKVRMEETNTLDRHMELYRAKIDAMASMRDNLEYYHLFMQTYYLQLQTYEPLTADELRKLEEITSSPYLQADVKPMTLFGAMTRLEVQARCSLLASDIEKDLHYTIRKIELFDANPHFRVHRRYEYIYACGKVLWYYTYFRRYDDFEALMSRLKSLREETVAERIDLEFSIYYADFIYLVQRCRIQSARELIPEILAFFEKHRPEIETSSILQFKLAFLGSAIKAGDFRDALRWLGELLNEKQFSYYIRWIETARLLGVIIYYELGEQEGLESMIRSYYRFLKKKSRLSEFDATLLLFLRRLPGIIDRCELRRAFEDLRTALVDLSLTPEGKMRLFQFDYISWLDSKIAGRTFEEILREKEGKVEVGIW